MANLRQRLLDASKKATQVLSDAGTSARLQSGFSRIDPMLLAQEQDVPVMLTEQLDKLLGAFLREGRAGIIVNSDRPIGMMHMTCAHELGHYFLGHVSTHDEHIDYGDTDSVAEQEANQFAYQLMAPMWLVVRTVKAKGWGKTNLLQPAVVYQLSLRLGISFTAMAWALARLKLVTPAQASTLCVAKPKALKNDMLPPGIALGKNADVWVLDSRDKDWIIEPRSTDRFLLNLPSHATAGYLWSADELAGEGFTVSPVLVDARAQKREGPPLVGGGGEDRYFLAGPAAEQQGGRVSEFHLRETRPWVADDAPATELALKMKFEAVEEGLSDSTRLREIQPQ
jgi:Zn-dependent peptidase ImmA (M78 family)